MENKKFIIENQRMKELMGLKPINEGKSLEVFPVGGNRYNIGWDEDWDNFDDPKGTANSDFSEVPTGAGAGGHPHGHHGIDIFGPRGAAIYAPVDGVVKINKSNGNTVIIQDKDGYSHWLGHLDTITVKDGKLVKAGKKVGTLGDSGNAKGTAPHLHYNVYKTDQGFYSADNPISDLKNSVGKEPDDEIQISDDMPQDFLDKLEKAYDDFFEKESNKDKKTDGEKDTDNVEKSPEVTKAKDEKDMFDILIDKGKEFISKLFD